MIELDVPALDFTAETTKGKIKLYDFRNKWVVLFAYPADFTPICEADIIGFAQKKQDFDKMGVQFIGWSVDPLETHLRWIEDIKTKTGVKIDYTLIADIHKKLAEKYGILRKAKKVTYRGLFIMEF
jgi:peroxiredoxin (alkyl hydroperoxide reductase subunit C)